MWDGEQLDDPSHRATFTDFFNRVPTHMTSLHLTGGAVSAHLEEGLTEIFSCIPQLQQLTLEEQVKISGILRLLPILNALTPRSADTSSLTSRLPALRVITFLFTGAYISPTESFEFLNKLVTLVAFRQQVDYDAKVRIGLDTVLKWPEKKGRFDGGCDLCDS